MTSASLALEGQARVVARRRDRPVLAAWAVVATGALLLAAALVLLALVERAGVPSSGHPSAGRVLVRILPGACMLVPGALVLVHLFCHLLGWILSAAGLGSVLAGASTEYAIYSHFVNGLPAGEWAGWVSEWASSTIVLVPGVALLLFPDGRLPGPRWRPALWCGLAAAPLVALNGALGIGEDLAFQGNPFLSDPTARSVGEPFGVGWFLLIVATLAGIAAIGVRRRRAKARRASSCGSWSAPRRLSPWPSAPAPSGVSWRRLRSTSAWRTSRSRASSLACDFAFLAI